MTYKTYVTSYLIARHNAVDPVHVPAFTPSPTMPTGTRASMLVIGLAKSDEKAGRSMRSQSDVEAYLAARL